MTVQGENLPGKRFFLRWSWHHNPNGEVADLSGRMLAVRKDCLSRRKEVRLHLEIKKGEKNVRPHHRGLKMGRLNGEKKEL